MPYESGRLTIATGGTEALEQSKMQTVFPRIWTQFADSIYYNYNCYTNYASKNEGNEHTIPHSTDL